MDDPYATPSPGGPRRQGLAVTSLVLGFLSLPTLGLVGLGALAAVVLGIVALVKAERQPAEYGGKGLAIGGIALAVVSIVIMPFVLGVIAAVAIPSFLRARVSANEATAIGDVRAVVAAQAAYSATFGYYDRLECLAAPADCAQGQEGQGAFIDRGLAEATAKSGYSRTFVPGRPLSEERPGLPSRSAMASFAFVAVPLSPNESGVRAFCGDATGTVCAWRDAARMNLEEVFEQGACPPTCEPL